MAKKTLEDFKERALRNPEVRAEYETLEPKFRAEQERIEREIKERVKEYQLPSKEKIKWLVKNVPDSEARTMIGDLLKAAAKACSLADFNILKEMIMDWEATIEAYNNPELMEALQEHSGR